MSFCRSFSFWEDIDDFEIIGDVFADVIGVLTELPTKLKYVSVIILEDDL